MTVPFALNPHFTEAWDSKGLALEALGRPEEALACFDRALALDPRYALAWNNKGAVLEVLGRPEEALICFDCALALNPRHTLAWSNKGVVLFNKFRRYREALACFEEAEKLGYLQAAQAIAQCRRILQQVVG